MANLSTCFFLGDIGRGIGVIGVSSRTIALCFVVPDTKAVGAFRLLGDFADDLDGDIGDCGERGLEAFGGMMIWT